MITGMTVNPWVHPQCSVAWDILDRWVAGGSGLPLACKRHLRGTREESLWLPLLLHAERFRNISPPGSINWVVEEMGTGTAAGAGGGSSGWREPWIWCCPASHHTLYWSPLGVTAGFKPVPVCLPVRNNFGSGEDPTSEGTATAASSESMGSTTGDCGFPWALTASQHPSEPLRMWSRLGAGVGCSRCPRGCLVQG